MTGTVPLWGGGAAVTGTAPLGDGGASAVARDGRATAATGPESAGPESDARFHPTPLPERPTPTTAVPA